MSFPLRGTAAGRRLGCRKVLCAGGLCLCPCPCPWKVGVINAKNTPTFGTGVPQRAVYGLCLWKVGVKRAGNTPTFDKWLCLSAELRVSKEVAAETFKVARYASSPDKGIAPLQGFVRAGGYEFDIGSAVRGPDAVFFEHFHEPACHGRCRVYEIYPRAGDLA